MVDGCSTKNGTGLCPKHGAINMTGKCKKHDSRTVACSAEGCSTTAIARRVCSKHGALGTCSFKKCTSAVAARGRCGKHGGSRGEMCKDEGCTTRALGAHGTCKFAGCSTNATSTSPYCANKALERKAVPRGGMHHLRCTQGSLRKTRRRSGRMHFRRRHQPTDGKHVAYLHNARRQRVLNILEEAGGVLACKCLSPALKWGGNCYKHTGI